MSIRKELSGVKAALDAQVPEEYREKARALFLKKWMSSPAGLHIGRNPERRGWFAREAGFTESELGMWNKIIVGKELE